MSKVYIINKGGYDYSAAAEFGELVFCTEGLVDRYDINQMYRELSVALADSIAGDFILVTSLTSLCSIAAAIYAERHHELNLLIYKKGKYLSRSIQINNDN